MESTEKVQLKRYHCKFNEDLNVFCVNSFLCGQALTHFWSMFLYYISWEHQKTFGFLVFSAGIKWEHWPEMV